MDAGGRAAPGAAAENGVWNSRRGGTSPWMDEVDRAGSWRSRATPGAVAEVLTKYKLPALMGSFNY